MKLTFIGDCHGKIEVLLPLLRSRCQESNFVLQLGDMGLGFRGVTLPNLPHSFAFIRGNHDSPDLCRMHDNYAGEFGNITIDSPNNEHVSVFVVGGAYSIDWQWRVPGVSWWTNEELTIEQGYKALEAYEAAKPRIVATHEAPQQIAEALLRDRGLRPEKWGSTQSRTAQLLQRMFEVHQPEYWYFGHYHRDWQLNLKGARAHFQCLNELNIAHIDTEEKLSGHVAIPE